MFKSVLYALVGVVIGGLAFLGTLGLMNLGVHPWFIFLGICLVFLAFIWEFRVKPGEHPWDTE